MTNFVPVNQARLGDMGWRPATNYAFAAKRNLVPLVASEFGKAAVSAPIAFVPEAEGFAAVAVFSLLPEDNLFVTPAGQWVGGYAPAALRAYPFQFGHVSGQQAVLIVDENSGLVFENDPQAERFFEADGTQSPAIGRVMEFLGQLDHERFVTQQAITALKEAGLIQPWSLSVIVCGKETAVNGLHRIDEAALRALDDAEFCKLRRFSVLSLAYTQLLSSGLVSIFERLSDLRRDFVLREQRTPSVEEFLAAKRRNIVEIHLEAISGGAVSWVRKQHLSRPRSNSKEHLGPACGRGLARRGVAQVSREKRERQCGRTVEDI